MSTSYYCIAKPVSALRVHDNTDELGTIEFWIAGEYAGALTMNKHHVKSFVSKFTEYTDDFNCPLHSHWGGADRGSIVTVNRRDIGDDELVISEYGELLTVGQVKARAGAKRKDGFPTELFGYEDSA